MSYDAGRIPWPRRPLAALLAATGAAHLVWPAAFERLVPTWLPGTARLWNRLTTIAELGAATLLADRRTARAGGVAAVATLAAVWTANIQAAIDGGYRDLPGWLGTPAAAWVRVPLQIPLLWWAVTVARARSDGPRSPSAEGAARRRPSAPAWRRRPGLTRADAGDGGETQP